MPMMQLVTILFLRKNNTLLLAMKKRGFGVGKWNGVGGKAEPNETPQAAAIRECQEEIGVTPKHPKLVGKIRFYEKSNPDFGHHAYIYVTDEWTGDPRETEEMQPRWFPVHHLPFRKMWIDDHLWIPLMLKGTLFEATFTLDGDRIYTYDITPVASLAE